MLNAVMRPLAFFANRWRVWLPPAIFMIIFVGAVVLSEGKETLSFVYRIF
jgi:hypothetical protein